MTLFEHLTGQTAKIAHNPENYTGFGLRTVRIHGEDFLVHDTRNFLTNFGIIHNLQSREPANRYEELMGAEIRARKVQPVIDELSLSDPKLYNTLKLITDELGSAKRSEEIYQVPLNTEPVEDPARDEVMDLYRYWASQGFDALAPIARKHFRDFDIGFFCR